MRLSPRQFEVVTGRPAPARPVEKVDLAPVMERLAKIEMAVLGIPMPAPSDTPSILARLDAIEDRIKARPSYRFEVIRDSAGRITTVNAAPTAPKT